MERRDAEEVDAVTRLHQAAVTGNVATLVDLLNEHPLLLDQIIVQTVKSLVGEKTKGLDVNASNYNGGTPLDLLLQSRRNCRDMEIAKFLQDDGPRSGSTDIPAQTPLAGSTTVTRTSKKGNGDTREKKKRKKRNDEWVRNMSNSLMIVASLIATVSFAAIITPAGGVFQENTPKSRHLSNSTAGTLLGLNFTYISNSSEHYLAGSSIMALYQPHRYLLYYCANTAAFLLSLAIILLLVSGFSLRRRFIMWILIITLWTAIFALVFTYFQASSFLAKFPDDLDRFCTGDFKKGILLGLTGMALLVLIVASANILRLFWCLVKKCIKCIRAVCKIVSKCIKCIKVHTRQQTTTTQDGGV